MDSSLGQGAAQVQGVIGSLRSGMNHQFPKPITDQDPALTNKSDCEVTSRPEVVWIAESDKLNWIPGVAQPSPILLMFPLKLEK